MHRRKSMIYFIESNNWRKSSKLNIHCTRIKFKCSNQTGSCHLSNNDISYVSCVSRQNQVNELLRIQQSSVEREHELSEDFRLKLSTIHKDINQIRKTYDNRLEDLQQKHDDRINRLRDEHQSTVETLKHDLQRTFTIEHDAQAKFYSQTIDALKREHERLLSAQNIQQMTRAELDDEYIQQRQQMANTISQLEQQCNDIRQESALALIDERSQLKTKIEQIEQLQHEFARYKEKFHVDTDHVDELNEQVRKN
jgi:DNA repair exonuclease SbcCD ATPase subunit